MDVWAVTGWVVLPATLAIPIWTTIRWRERGVPIGAVLAWVMGCAYWLRDGLESPDAGPHLIASTWFVGGWMCTLVYSLIVYGLVQAFRGPAEQSQEEQAVVEFGNQPPPSCPAPSDEHKTSGPVP